MTPDSHRASPVVLFGPALEEYARTLRVFVGLAGLLAHEGVPVRRWAPGQGQCSRAEDLRLTRLDEASAEALAGQTPSIVGLRLGGYLAARALSRGLAHRVVLWEPVVDPRQYLREVTRVALANQLTTYGEVRFSAETLMEKARVDGYLLADGYALSVESFDSLEGAPAMTPEALVEMRERVSVIFWRSRKSAERWADAGFDAVYLPDVKLAWDNIRYFDAKATELVNVTMERLRR